MPTFIDESGDVGPQEGCARHFRLAGVWFETRDHVSIYNEMVVGLRLRLNVSQNFEFHFAKLSHERRVAFFQSVAEIPFGFAVCAFEKQGYDRATLTKEKIRYETIDGLAAILSEVYLSVEQKRLGGALNEAIRYDECYDANYEKLLKERFRSFPSSRGDGKKLVGDVKPGKSKSEPCIQLADMVCGAASRYLDGDNQYYDIISANAIGVNVIVANRERAARLP